MASQWQRRPQRQCIDQKPIGPAIIVASSSRRREPRPGVERERGRIVFGHFKEHFLRFSRQGFRRRLTEKNPREARTARAGQRADAENFRLPRGGLDENEGLRFSRRRILGREGEHALPRQK